jgi:GH25 family lysozyme M1 (1,4-beta-N-acetylmuramidase)
MILGIDTASVAGPKNVDWTATKAHGPISFAILRAAWGVSPDQFFRSQFSKVVDAGLVAGAYLFLRFPTKESPRAPTPKAQAEVFLAELNRVDYTERVSQVLPPAIDVEFPGEGAIETGMTPAQLLDGVRAAWTTVATALGCAPIVYTSARVWRDDLKNIAAPDLTDSPLWLARYPYKAGPAVRDPSRLAVLSQLSVPIPWGADNWWIHQYQGDATGLPGFPIGKMDMNRWNVCMPGERGRRAAWVQRRLKMLGPVTGVMDAATVDVLRRFQAKAGLVADGYVGPRTFARLAW